MNRKGFFKALFGGFVAASAAPSLIKAEESPQPPKDLALGKEVLRIDERGNVGIGGSGYVGLGTNAPSQALHVSSIIFHGNNRRLQMGQDENGDFIIKWLDVEKDEMNNSITIHQPKVNPWKTKFNQIN